MLEWLIQESNWLQVRKGLFSSPLHYNGSGGANLLSDTYQYVNKNKIISIQP
jgi:hypothetical protein